MLARRSLRLSAGLLAGALLFSGCGGGEDKNEGGTRDCDGTPLSSNDIELPSDFPIPDELILTTSSAVGPSQIVDGYFGGDLQDAYDAWKEAFDGAGYTILFDEIEREDSEISYASGDVSSTGQVALRSECMQSDRTFVHITNRPA